MQIVGQIAGDPFLVNSLNCLRASSQLASNFGDGNSLMRPPLIVGRVRRQFRSVSRSRFTLACNFVQGRVGIVCSQPLGTLSGCTAGLLDVLEAGLESGRWFCRARAIFANVVGCRGAIRACGPDRAGSARHGDDVADFGELFVFLLAGEHFLGRRGPADGVPA